MPSLPLGNGVIVELHRSDAGTCWSARFDDPEKDRPTRFRAAVP